MRCISRPANNDKCQNGYEVLCYNDHKCILCAAKSLRLSAYARARLSWSVLDDTDGGGRRHRGARRRRFLACLGVRRPHLCVPICQPTGQVVLSWVELRKWEVSDSGKVSMNRASPASRVSPVAGTLVCKDGNLHFLRCCCECPLDTPPMIAFAWCRSMQRCATKQQTRKVQSK